MIRGRGPSLTVGVLRWPLPYGRGAALSRGAALRRFKPIVSKLLAFVLRHRAILAVGICSLIALSHVQYANHRLLDWDIYYHLKFSLLSLRSGIMQDFPWCQFSLFKDSFADKEFLFHVLLMPFVGYDPYEAGKLFPVVVGTLIVLLLFLVLRQHKVIYPWLWLLLLLAWTPVFLFRFISPRPHLLAMIAFVLMVHAVMTQRRLLIFAVACFFPLTHSLAVLIWTLPVLYEINRFRLRQKVDWRSTAVTFAGLLVGFVAHPNFPNNVRVLYIQAVVIPRMLWFGKDLRFGMEFLPFDTRSFLLQNWLPILLNAAVWCGTLRVPARPTP